MKRLATCAAAALFAFATGSAVGVSPPNFQLKAPARTSPAAGAAAKAARAPSRFQSRFHWADRSGPALPLSPLAADKRAEAAARSALAAGSAKLGLTAAQAAAAELRELHDLGRGPVIARYQQKHEGLDVFGAQVSVIMDRNHKPIAYSGASVKTGPAAGGKAVARSATGRFALGTEAATQAALRDLSRSSKVPGLALLAAPAKFDRMYYADAGGMIPAYRFTLRAAQADGVGQLAYGYLVSAADGSILVRKNLMNDAAFTYRVYADPLAPFTPYDGPLGDARTPFPGATPDDNPPRVPVASQLVTAQNGPISTNDPWLVPQATTTNGLNVRAYADINQPDGIGGDGYPTTSTTTFDYAAVPDGSPASGVARRAGVVNMFFTTNWLHDFWYDHGFDEAAGNAQVGNYGRGGLGNDPILAESQDFSGRNNANMFTPPDGESPVMQMYLFDGGAASLDVTAPDLGSFFAGPADFGPQSFELSDTLAAVDDGIGTGTDGCTAFGGVTGAIAVIDRGACDFTVKVKNAQGAGAVGALIINNVPNDGAVGMGGVDGTITIPALSVSLEDGAAIRGAMAGATVSVTMLRESGEDRDAALDNGIIAHEYFHHVSNRLVNDAFGLINQQGGGMGEGWSDFASMMLFVRPEDQGLAGNSLWGGSYGTGVYVDSSAYFGVRRAPYSTDFAVNPLTFQHIQDGVALPDTVPLQFGGSGADNSEVHNTGEIWAGMLWEAYAALLNDPRHTFADAQGRMQDYVIAGLKVLPLTPTFIEARDGILAAALATDAEDHAVIAEAFARRGIGVGAIGPGPDSTDNVGVTESYVAFAAQYAIDDFDLDLRYDDGTLSYCDSDTALDPGETALLTFTVASVGTVGLPAGATIEVGTDGDATLGNGGSAVLPALAVGQTHAFSMPVTLNSAGGTAEPLTLTIAFPDFDPGSTEVFEPATIERLLNVNLDIVPARNHDDVEVAEIAQTDWTVELTAPESGPPWLVTDLDADFGTGSAWYAHDNGAPASSLLTTPEITVDGAFTVEFDHFFEFEEPFDTGAGLVYFDGGVVEISVDGGDWQDVTDAGGTFATGYNGEATAFDIDNPREAFVDTNGAMATETLAFGNALDGHTVRLRFRLESDESVGAFGWVVDNIALTGVAGFAFSGAVAEDGVCNRVPMAGAGPDQAVDEGELVTLAGSASDADGDTLSIAWTRLSGPAVTLSNANTLAPTFTAPNVSTSTPITLRLTVGDGIDTVTDDVVVTVANVAGGGGGGGGGGGALGGGLAAFGLLALLRSRRRPPPGA